jgi:hypothetical protein
MKTKAMIFLLIMIIAVMLLSFFSAHQSLKLAPPPQDISREEVNTGLNTDMRPRLMQVPLPKPGKRAITIIKTPRPIKEPPSALETEAERPQQSRSTSTTQESGAAGSTGNQTDSGISKIDKYPTKEQIKEMNSKGIIIY